VYVLCTDSFAVQLDVSRHQAEPYALWLQIKREDVEELLREAQITDRRINGTP
jgi:hypothetical protein